MDGNRDSDPHWSIGLSSQGPDEEQKEGEYEQGSPDRKVCATDLLSNGSSPRLGRLGLKEHVSPLTRNNGLSILLGCFSVTCSTYWITLHYLNTGGGVGLSVNVYDMLFRHP